MPDTLPGEDFVPYTPADQTVPELTVAAVVLGLLQAVFFGVADAYLGLKLGMTVGASIPAAVISMGILRGVLRRGTILENNVVQNMASVGESLAGGVVFTLPSLFILAAAMQREGTPMPFSPGAVHIFLIACVGGWLGILFMIPLRRALIVREHGKLRYPEGVACAEVLIAGARGGDHARTVFEAMAVAGVFRFAMNGLGLMQEVVAWPITTLRTAMSFDLLPSLLAVGFIIGLETSAMMLSGALLGWLVIIPCIAYFGAHLAVPMAPETTRLIAQMTPDDLRLQYLRYIGAGGVAMGGLVSLVRSLPTIVSSVGGALTEITSTFGAGRRAAASGVAARDDTVPRTARDIPMSWVLGGGFILLVAMAAMLAWSMAATGATGVNRPLVSIVGGLLAVIFAFFFVSVASRVVGIVGTTSMPTMGMTIGALIFTCVLLKSLHLTGAAGVLATLAIGAVICIAISMGGDISQDLKIGFLVGATPRVVQVTQLLSVLIASGSVAAVVLALSPLVTGGTPQTHLEAPQANLMYMLARGIMGGQLPWELVFIGMGVAACVELLGVGSLPFAVGLYLPLELSTTIMFGGLLQAFLMRRLPAADRKAVEDRGLLVASGLVAGDAIIGVCLGIVAARTGSDLPTLLLPSGVPWAHANWVPCVAFAALVWYLGRRAGRLTGRTDQ